VVWELEVLSPRVDVHLGPNDLAGHGTALDVPTCTGCLKRKGWGLEEEEGEDEEGCECEGRPPKANMVQNRPSSPS
jgi:hypothetical protein